MSDDSPRFKLQGEVPSVGAKPKMGVSKWSKDTVLKDGVLIRRYMSIGKFLRLLAAGSLWFSRLDKLGDPFEGAAPKSEIDGRSSPSTLEHYWAGCRRWMVVNCWHASSIESDAMWKVYAPDGEGLAIQSSIVALAKVIGESTIHYADSDLENPKPLGYPRLGYVKYVDYEEIKIEGEKGISRYFLKRKAFYHEQEFRVVAALPEAYEEKGVDINAEPGIAGVNVVVDLGTLIQKVLISPIAPKWFSEAVEDLLKTYGIKCEVEVSALARNPQY